jgi:lipoate-protein ligase B
MNNTLAPFKLIHPCRLEAEVMTSMAQVVGEPVDETEVTSAVGRSLLHYFTKQSHSR